MQGKRYAVGERVPGTGFRVPGPKASEARLGEEDLDCVGRSSGPWTTAGAVVLGDLRVALGPVVVTRYPVPCTLYPVPL